MHVCLCVIGYLYEPEQLLPRLPLRLSGSGGDVEPAQRRTASLSAVRPLPAPPLPVTADDPPPISGAEDDEHDDGDDDVK